MERRVVHSLWIGSVAALVLALVLAAAAFPFTRPIVWSLGRGSVALVVVGAAMLVAFRLGKPRR